MLSLRPRLVPFQRERQSGNRPASMKASLSMTRVGGLVPAGSRLCFEDHIERRLGGASDIAEAAGRDDLAQLGLAGLCAESRTHFL